jgi:hypothetical protein
MYKKLIALASMIAILGAATVYGVSAQSGAPTPTPHARRMVAPRNERHPELYMALRALTRARMLLNKAAHDFHGHRADAEKLTEQAIQQVHQAIQIDKK